MSKQSIPTGITTNKDPKDALYFLDSAPFDPGGVVTEIERYKEVAIEINPDKPIAIITDWVWWDLEVTAEQRQLLVDMGMLPIVLQSNNLMYDERKRFKPGSRVRTSLLSKFHKSAIFETKNTFYILIGPGQRKSVPLTVLEI